MARPLRIEFPGAYYHIMSRGNAGEKIFLSNRDKEKFTEYLLKFSDRFSIFIHTYCLMSNHYHLVVETPQANLSIAVQWLNVSYATYHNRKRDRKGHLFQGRFRSILIEADEYLTQLSRYIHLNPVRAKIVKNPEDYQWSSYRAYIGKKEVPEWLKTELLLSHFGSKRKKAIQAYKAFIDEVNITTLENPEKHLVGGFILGGRNFVTWVQERYLADRGDEKEIPQLRKLRTNTSLDRIIKAVADTLGCSQEEIRQKGKKSNKARDISIYLARDLSGISCMELGKYFGGISGAAVTLRYNWVNAEIKQNKKFNQQINRIKKRILNN